MVSDSRRSSACTNFGMLIRFFRFSPFAEEGFTCLDHSMLSKKKKHTTRLLKNAKWGNVNPECCLRKEATKQGFDDPQGRLKEARQRPLVLKTKTKCFSFAHCKPHSGF